ncbi:hypothetical protein J8I87_05430, partial [Paraburkholderia sp. LEh10]|uniref:hypothetical protein n=1 Tax=Paraburkholderia sp. LEh10 TaxID=2821353 RepID=UPI001AE8BE9A
MACADIRDAVGFAAVAGIRECGLLCHYRGHPRCGLCFAAVAGIRDAVCLLPLSLASAMRLAAQALPLCGAAPTFLCRLQRKVGKRKQL